MSSKSHSSKPRLSFFYSPLLFSHYSFSLKGQNRLTPLFIEVFHLGLMSQASRQRKPNCLPSLFICSEVCEDCAPYRSHPPTRTGCLWDTVRVRRLSQSLWEPSWVKHSLPLRSHYLTVQGLLEMSSCPWWWGTKLCSDKAFNWIRFLSCLCSRCTCSRCVCQYSSHLRSGTCTNPYHPRSFPPQQKCYNLQMNDFQFIHITILSNIQQIMYSWTERL